MYNSSSARRLVAIQLTPQALTLVEQGTASFVLPNVISPPTPLDSQRKFWLPTPTNGQMRWVFMGMSS